MFGADTGLLPALKPSQNRVERPWASSVILRKVVSLFCFSSPRVKFVLLTQGVLISVGRTFNPESVLQALSDLFVTKPFCKARNLRNSRFQFFLTNVNCRRQ